jgi:hypothetical protein
MDHAKERRICPNSIRRCTRRYSSQRDEFHHSKAHAAAQDGELTEQ